MRRGWQTALHVDDTLEPERQFTARYIMAVSLVVGGWTLTVALVAIDTSPMLRLLNACLSAVFLGTYWVCRSGRPQLALYLYVAEVLVGGSAMILLMGTRVSSLSALAAIPLAAAVFARPRTAIYLLLCLVVAIVGVDWAVEQGAYLPPAKSAPLSWQPTARQLVFIPLIAMVLRWGYDSVNRELLGRTQHARDVADAATARKRRLVHEVEERTASLAARTELRQSVAVAFADELDEPLAHMVTSLRALTEGTDDAHRQRLQDLLRAADAGERMRRMIERLLEHARLGSEAKLDDEIDLERMVASIVEEASRDASTVTWQLDALPTLLGDRALIRAAIENLVSNAIKFSRERARPEIVIGYDREQDALFVRDNGVGFDTGYASKLFQPFQRAHGGKFEGVGVGLANVRRIAELHGGRAWAEAEVDIGATFFVRFGPESRA